jgi:hypothetical protein
MPERHSGKGRIHDTTEQHRGDAYQFLGVKPPAEPGKGRMVDVTSEGLAFQFLGVKRAEPTGGEWTCRWCGYQNRGTDSSRYCEQCGTSR